MSGALRPRSAVLVTGGCGFIGSHLTARLAAEGHRVRAFDSAPPPPLLDRAPGVDYVQGDVTDPSAVAGALTAETEAVFHLSAVVGVDRYLSRPLDVIDVNVLGTRNVLHRALETDTAVVLASTSEVFGKNPAAPWAEDGDRVLGPTTAERWTYSASKGLAEHMVFALARGHGLRASIVRYFNVYGPGQRPAYVISRSVHRILNGERPEVYDRGDQTRCFTYIDDAVDGTLRAAADPRALGEAFNIGRGAEHTMAEAVGLVCRLSGTGITPRYLDTGAALGPGYEDIARRVPDVRKAARVLGWEAGVDLEKGVAHTLEWARATPRWLE